MAKAKRAALYYVHVRTDHQTVENPTSELSRWSPGAPRIAPLAR